MVLDTGMSMEAFARKIPRAQMSHPPTCRTLSSNGLWPKNHTTYHTVKGR